MSDTISRQAAIDALMVRDKELRNINWYDKPFSEGECRGVDYALEIVNAFPSVQPLTAYVISDEDGNIKCSNCGSFECWGNYCMNCGAKMRGKNNG